MDSNEKLQERRKHPRKKVRVLVRFNPEFAVAIYYGL